jgi:hypothetical protein
MKVILGSMTVVLLACGGAIDTTLLDGGDGGGNKDGGGGKDGAAGTCDSLLAQLSSEEAAAIACCPTCNVQQCAVQVPGLCCPLSVTNADSNTVKTYEDTLQAIKDAHCDVACPALACSTNPSGQCTQQSAQTGTCAQ